MDSKLNRRITEELLKNVCQVPSCGKVLHQYVVFCRIHWLMAPTWARTKFNLAFKRLGLDESLPRTTAWGKTVEALGAIEAGDRLGVFQEALDSLKRQIQERILGDSCQRIKDEKWKGEKFKKGRV